MQCFGIVTDVNTHSYTSCADNCTGLPVTLTSTHMSCEHSYVNHKTRENIRDEIVSLYGPGTETTVKLSWTGHVLENGNAIYNSGYRVVVMTIEKATDVNNNNLSGDIIRKRRLYTLLHELSHHLGAPDHYCYGDITEDGGCSNPSNDCYTCDYGLTEYPSCIMYTEIYDLESKLANGKLDEIYCPQCRSDTNQKGISWYLNRYFQ